MGYRGYVFSRPFMGQRQPTHIQNIVIRDYCRRHGMEYLLSATEYAIPKSYMVLHQTLNEFSKLEGIVMYSLFLLPKEAAGRQAIFRRVIEEGSTLHFAVEGLKMRDPEGQQRIEEIWQVALALPHCPNTV